MKEKKSKFKVSQMFITEEGKNYALTFSLVCILFLLWGLCNGMIDVLNKHFQNSLGISKAQSALVQGAWYGAYFLMAIPSGWVARRFGYKGGILSGLAIVIIGSLLFVPVTKISGSTGVVFSFFLAALFVVASGLTFLETIANPYTTVLGPVKSSVARINLAQSCNAVGWILGPVIGGTFILSNTEKVNTSNASLYFPYLFIAGIVAVILTIFIFAPIPDLHAAQETKSVPNGSKHEKPLFKEWHFVLAIVSQFLYCAAQTGIFSFFINYVKDYMPPMSEGVAHIVPNGMTYMKDGLVHITERGASMLLAAGGFGLFLIGRFTGSLILRYTKPHITLGFYALANIAMMAIVILMPGWFSITALLMSFFFMSIMYPTHFALAIRGLGEKTKLGSSFMVTAIVGGSVMPILMGLLADNYSMRVGFMMPLICFIFIMLYGFNWQRFFVQDMQPEEIS
jgi:FHS family L-fucose permease-like MFS transporter